MTRAALATLLRDRTLRVALLASAIALVLLLAPVDFPRRFEWWVNAAHAPLFFVLAFAWRRAFGNIGLSTPLADGLALALCLGLALAAEAAQALVPGRTADLGDVARGALGALAGAAAHLLLQGARGAPTLRG